MAARLRFAPSPTGRLHLGNARTALFNWLMARRLGGTFILRVEDTDAERSAREHEEHLIDVLSWLGIPPDEGPMAGGEHGPYRQSERLASYHAKMEELVEAGKAFWSPAGKGEVHRFDEQYRDARLGKGEADAIAPAALRFKAPKADRIEIEDQLRGTVKIDARQIGDFVLARTDASPLYNFACVVDDTAMGITHVVRGEDHLTNTAKQVMLYHAFGWSAPDFLHLPLVLGPDGSPLSKRHGDVSVERFREEGVIPEALVNHLALLGWGPGDDREVFDLNEIVPLFEVSRLNRSPAKFFPKKTRWFNGQHLRRLPDDALAQRLGHALQDAGYDVPWEKVLPYLPAVRERLRGLSDALMLLGPFFRAPDPAATRQLLEETDPDALPRLRELLTLLESEPDWMWTAEALEQELEAWREEKGYEPKEIWQPLRIALTGSKVSPPIFDTLELLGRTESLSRLEKPGSP